MLLIELLGPPEHTENERKDRLGLGLGTNDGDSLREGVNVLRVRDEVDKITPIPFVIACRRHQDFNTKSTAVQWECGHTFVIACGFIINVGCITFMISVVDNLTLLITRNIKGRYGMVKKVRHFCISIIARGLMF